MNTTFRDLKEKRILVTGGTSGIGFKIVESLDSQSAYMTLLGRNESKMKEVAAKFPSVQDFCICDQAIVTTIESSLGTLSMPFDGVVFSAGIADFMPIKFLKLEKIQEIYNVNFFSNVLILKYLIMKKLLNKKASIIFISSISQYVAETGTSIYSSSKAAVSAFARNAALELAPSSIRVNTISPGLVRTNLLNDAKGVLSDSVLGKNAANYPLGLGRVEDVSAAVLYFLSEDSKWVTGSDLKMDGGFCLK